MRRPSVIGGLILIQSISLGAASREARAGTIWQWTHEAQGKGWANVYDGGPVVYASSRTDTYPFGSRMKFDAYDLTRPGALGASYGTAGQSGAGYEGDIFAVGFRFSTSYSASSHIDADRPGGEGHGWVSAVAEFVAPADNMPWFFYMDVSTSPGFTGSARLLVENVSRPTVLLDVGRTLVGDYILDARRGDVVRISFEAFGEGSVPPGIPAFRDYFVLVNSEFRVPEPCSAALLGLAAVVLKTRHRRRESR